MARAVQVDWILAGIRDTSGQPLAAGRVYTYVAGTTTSKDTYTTYTQSAAQANPIILDSNGRALVFAQGLYKFVVKDSDDVTVYTYDGLNYSYLGDWETYNPTWYESGAMTFTGASSNYARYRREGGAVRVKVSATGIIGGTLSNYVSFDLPILADAASEDIGVAKITQTSYNKVAKVEVASTSLAQVYTLDAANFAAGSATVVADFVYKAA